MAESNAASKPAPKLSDDDRRTIDAAIEKIYARYRKPPEVDGESDLGPPAGYAEPLEGLVTNWMKGQPEGEIDSALSEADWFCQCQDWPGKGFKFLDKTIKPLPDGQVEARIRFDLGDGMPQKARILFAKVGSDWKVADLFIPGAPKGVVAQIRSDLARWKKK